MSEYRMPNHCHLGSNDVQNGHTYTYKQKYYNILDITHQLQNATGTVDFPLPIWQGSQLGISVFPCQSVQRELVSSTAMLMPTPFKHRRTLGFALVCRILATVKLNFQCMLSQFLRLVQGYMLLQLWLLPSLVSSDRSKKVKKDRWYMEEQVVQFKL